MEAYWIWLATRPGVSDRLKNRILEEFPDAEAVFYAEESRLRRIDGMTAEAMSVLLDRDLTEAKQIIAECRAQDIGILTLGSENYPDRLRNIPDPPLVLYYKGKLPEFDRLPVIGVVGTRSCSLYGVNTAKRLGYQIAACGALVVSGMAKGLDTAAMQGALLAGHGTVAVLGCGVDVIYPPSNRKLYEDTVAFGCVISEYIPGTPPLRFNFPRRNRIISGLSCGVLVVEAPEKSGALITARLAAEQGRDVFVVPGNIDVASCVGSNRLLRDGAIAVSSGWDVAGEYSSSFPDQIQKNESALSADLPYSEPETELRVAEPRRRPEKSEKQKLKSDKKVIDNAASSPYSDENIKKLPPEQQAIVSALRSGARPIDDVIAESGLPSAKALSVLTLLELQGLVEKDSGKSIRLARSN